LDEEGNEMLLPKSEQIPSDYFKKGENVRAVVKKSRIEKQPGCDHSFQHKPVIPGKIT
jgi:transcription antitermination factor NusA-like protein